MASEMDCVCVPGDGCDEEGNPGCAYCRSLDCEWACPSEIGGECDWGSCDGEAVARRWSERHGWLPVCDNHRASGPMSGLADTDPLCNDTLRMPSEAMLGKADWTYDDSLGVHIPCCTRALNVLMRCGNGPLTGDAIRTGDCGEHDPIGPESAGS